MLVSMDTDFQTLGNWTQDNTDQFDWTLRSGSTPSSGTGPSSGVGGSGNYQLPTIKVLVAAVITY